MKSWNKLITLLITQENKKGKENFFQVQWLTIRKDFW
jgi:hypothetical protein